MIFDLVLVFGALISGFLGGRRGLVKQILSLASVYLSMLLAIGFQDALVRAFTQAVGLVTIETSIFFFVTTFLIAYIGLELLNFAFYRQTRLVALGLLDYLLGGFFGILWWLVLVGAILTMLFYSFTVPWTWRLAPIAAALRADFGTSTTLPTLAMLFKNYAIIPIRMLMDPLPPILTGWP
ncbi:CvpA family protein [Thermoflexus sp.]|uniref:CvpA family protein n=2 Tax=Thermoflexus sp. TaxID=1969742 RepID=UPI0025E969D9|nr:CvpA family protein [Thermoflexus sp.]MCS7350139.1 CvpA family protein [Thermoflexus sp.]MCX7689504.1 CvpA family protein [Thermoflexus sp.]MDW8179588.1 CvpA family protein [Anaerolineae bacterium]MDW8184900.1 CvpA family protein [Anaerolineae bacterium]